MGYELTGAASGLHSLTRATLCEGWALCGGLAGLSAYGYGGCGDFVFGYDITALYFNFTSRVYGAHVGGGLELGWRAGEWRGRCLARAAGCGWRGGELEGRLLRSNGSERGRMCGGGLAGRVRLFRGYVEGGVCMHVCEVAAGLCWPFRLAQICVRPSD